MDKERQWKLNRAGCFSCSELSNLMNKKGLGKMGKDMLYRIQWERNNKRSCYSRSNYNFDFGHRYEPIAVEWLRQNQFELGIRGNIKHCAEDFNSIIHVKNEYNLGGSPDCYIMSDVNPKIIGLIEIKTVESSTLWAKLSSPTMSYSDKLALVIEDHAHQLAGQFILFPEINEIIVLKYRPQIDDDMDDTISPYDISRGVILTITREMMGTFISKVSDRVKFCDKYLELGYDIELIEKATAVEENGIITNFEF